jgi:hypothetical protein
VEGDFTAAENRIGDLFLTQTQIHYRYERGQLILPRIQTRLGQGRLFGSAELILEPQPVYRAFLQAEGVMAEQLPFQYSPGPLRLVGPLSGQGTVHGRLNTRGVPTGPINGWGQFTMTPGSIERMDGTLFTTPITGNRVLSNPKQALSFDHLETAFIYHQRHADLYHLSLDADGLHLEGQGMRDQRDQLTLNLNAHADWWPEPEPQSIRVEGLPDSLVVRTGKPPTQTIPAPASPDALRLND